LHGILFAPVAGGADGATTGVSTYVHRVEQRPSPAGLRPGQGCALAGLFLAGLAIFVAPLLLGPAGMVLGIVADVRGERRGRWVAVLAALGLVLGILVGLLPDKFVMN
jgi:hypothetical protein